MTDKPVTAFVGDSITAAGAWQEWFADVDARNFGVDGDTTDGLLERLDEVIESEQVRARGLIVEGWQAEARLAARTAGEHQQPDDSDHQRGDAGAAGHDSSSHSAR